MSITTALIIAVFSALGDDRFVNFESPQVHPLDLSPSGLTLAACNTGNGTADFFTLESGAPTLSFSIPVGIDPASVRFRTETEVWVVNWLSDSISVIDLARRTIVRTLQVLDEPADVAFTDTRAFVTCSQPNTLLVFALDQLDAPPAQVPLHAKFPRALTMSDDGSRVYIATFQSGNRSTILSHDLESPVIPERVISRPDGPHQGQNPPFNGDGAFVPPLAPGLPPPPATDLIVKQDDTGVWRDDTGADWSRFVDGKDARASGRVEGWHLPDHDIAVVDTETLAISYTSGLMNICAAIALRPGTNEATVVGTDATNEIRFEPVLAGRMVKALVARVGVDGAAQRVDLNANHLDYTTLRIDPARRTQSIGEPRAIVWETDGQRGWIAGFGSNNVLPIDAVGARIGDGTPISVSEGPTGLALDAARGALYVLCRFGASIDTIDLDTATVTRRLPLYDPTPAAIREGRPFLYDTHATSGQGQVACASCHVDARTDGIAWDLGDPQGPYKSSERRNIRRMVPASAADDYHPMKGPRTTQTLQDIIGHEPFHWGGDRDNLESFADAYRSLLGADAALAPEKMSRLKAFLQTISFPPNPYRNLDNTLPENIDFHGMLAPAAPNEPRSPMPNGNARRGLDIYLSEETVCIQCHTLPSGRGSHLQQNDGLLKPTPVRPDGTMSLRVVAGANSSVQTVRKPQQFSGLYTKFGMDALSVDGSTAGFGLLSAGAVDTAMHFILSGDPDFANLDVQDSADLFALLLSWSGSEFPAKADGTINQPPGLPGRDSHAALGAQITLRGPQDPSGHLAQLYNIVKSSPRLEMIAHGLRNDVSRGWWLHGEHFEADKPGETVSLAELIAASAPNSETTFTVVAAGTGKRLGIDRDLDGILDQSDSTLDPVALDPSISDADITQCTTCEPSGQEINTGDTLCLDAGAPGATSFMWSFRNRVLSDFGPVLGATTHRLQVANLSEADQGMYRVDYFDPTGEAAQRFFVVTVAPPHRPLPWIIGIGLTLAALTLVFRLLRRRPTTPIRHKS